MTSKFVQCEFCEKETSVESCELANYRTMIDGVEHVFCCEKCAKQYEKTKKSVTSS